MCSVTFLPRDDGFLLAMNRDELRTRAAALPPEVSRRDGLAMLYPRERGGGTWVGINSSGMAFSLLNWHSQPDRAGEDLVSRGEVVRAVLSAGSPQAAARIVGQLPCERMNPFRLVAISLAERSLDEWRSGAERLEQISLPWTRQHWFSSGFDEAKANHVRRKVCDRLADDALNGPTLRALHRSHLPEAGSFSMCMHRPEAGTVSYTEISVRGSRAAIHYVPAPPCSCSRSFQVSLDLAVPCAISRAA
ncbi:MAG TPA: NRDE family protein [Terrimicrobiaceae bacterium]|nr:NRDE family protein [Terrimicrobiaceae bacterium]